MSRAPAAPGSKQGPAQRQRWGDGLSALTLLLASALGLWAFALPMLQDDLVQGGRDTAHRQDAPWLLLALLGLCLLVIVANLETRRMDSRVVAVLGILVAINGSLRLISGPLGASAVFLLPICCAYVFGADFGFLLATLSMLASAILTGGLGPWLPFQMFAAGWVAMVPGWLPTMPPRRAVVLLALWGGLAGLLFGVVSNLWFWPYLDAAAAPDHHWRPNMGIVQSVLRYAAFYLATSSWWDSGRAVGNVVLVASFGLPVMRLLQRFRQRFDFQLEEAGDEEQMSS